MTARLYVPATLDLLRAWHAAGEVPSVDDGYAAPDTTEEGEYAALMAAADDSAALLGDAGGRRVVVVVETDIAGGPVPLSEVVAVHADPAPFGDPEEDLAWYATQEIPDLISG